MDKRSKFKFSAGILLIALGLVLGMHESIHYRDIAFLPLSLGITVLLISTFVEISRRRSSLNSRGVGYGLLIILLAFLLAFIIIGVIIPLMYR